MANKSRLTANLVSSTGVSTFSNVVVGSGTTTGTPDQPLQVFGGAYISNPRVGIGTTVLWATSSRGLHIFGSGSNTSLRIQTGGTIENSSAELDLISNGTQNAFIDYGPNKLNYRATNTNGNVLISDVLVLESDTRIGINTKETPGFFPGQVNIFGQGGTNDSAVRIDCNTNSNAASVTFLNVAGSGTTDIFSAGFARNNGYSVPGFDNSVQFSIVNSSTFPRSFSFFDRNSSSASYFGLSSNLNEALFKVGSGNGTSPVFVVDSRNNKTGVGTTSYNSATLAVGGDVKVTGITSTRKLSSEFPFAYKNLIVNGDFSIDQRLAGTIATMTSSGVYYGLDKWSVASFGGDFVAASKMSVQQLVGSGITAVGISSTYLRVKCNNTLTYSSGLGAWLGQTVEPYSLRGLQCGTDNAQPFWLSFWARTNVGTGFTMSCTLEKGSALETYSQKVYVPNDNTWRKYILRYEAPKTGISTTQWYDDTEINITGVNLIFGLTSNGSWLAGPPQTWSSSTRHIFVDDQTNLCTNTANYIDLAAVQLEVGDSHTEFEHIPFHDNLRRCQRWFETNAPYGVRLGFNDGVDPHDTGSLNEIEVSTTTRGDGNFNLPIRFTVPKAGIPTMRGFIGIAGSSTTQWWVMQNGSSGYQSFFADAIGKYGFNARVNGGSAWTATFAYGYWIAHCSG
jgi:hypothetical protein